MISAQNSAFFNFGKNGLPGVTGPDHCADILPLCPRVKVVKDKHIRVVNLTAFPFTLPSFQVSMKLSAVPVASSLIVRIVPDFVFLEVLPIKDGLTAFAPILQTIQLTGVFTKFIFLLLNFAARTDFQMRLS